MATNRDLLKEAIADAKAVKETAIANAKAALTESFTPFLRDTLSAKIQEMDNDNDSYMDEKMYEEAEDLDEISLDELLAELEENDSKMEEENLYEAKEEEEEMSIEDMDEDDLKSFIEDVIKDMVSAGELEAGHEGMENEEGAKEEEEMPEEDMPEEDMPEEEVDIDELLAEIERHESLEELTANQSGATVSGDNKAIMAIAKMMGKAEEWVKKNLNAQEISKAFQNITKAAASATSVGTKESLELYENVKILKSELNETNLLNAKLLYTNKIFRSKSLNESQKIKVLTAFDKAKTKKEAQLVYETLLESLKVSSLGTKTSIKESLGSASKVLGSANVKPIIENNAFARMRELAGLKK